MEMTLRKRAVDTAPALALTKPVQFKALVVEIRELLFRSETRGGPGHEHRGTETGLASKLRQRTVSTAARPVTFL